MKTFKLILKSLISNNSCIDGARKKPWYFAVIMLFFSMIFAILPLFVQTIKAQGDDAFKTYAYGLDQAVVAFHEEKLNPEGIKMYVKTPDGATDTSQNIIVAERGDGSFATFRYDHLIPVKASDGSFENKVDFTFFVRENLDSYNEDVANIENSYVYITKQQLLIHLINFDTKATIKDLGCLNAAKYMENGRSINNMLSTSTDPTTKLSETFSNWKLFIRDAYNYSRLTTVWQTCAIMGGINLGIVVFMGLMVWILTRGKNNPYRLFNLWDTQKMAWWASLTPSILALAFGFLLTNFANILFPMLIGIRVMWLSMKSLRPDGTGYAESN